MDKGDKIYYSWFFKLFGLITLIVLIGYFILPNMILVDFSSGVQEVNKSFIFRILLFPIGLFLLYFIYTKLSDLVWSLTISQRLANLTFNFFGIEEKGIKGLKKFGKVVSIIFMFLLIFISILFIVNSFNLILFTNIFMAIIILCLIIFFIPFSRLVNKKLN